MVLPYLPLFAQQSTAATALLMKALDLIGKGETTFMTGTTGTPCYYSTYHPPPPPPRLIHGNSSVLFESTDTSSCYDLCVLVCLIVLSHEFSYFGLGAGTVVSFHGRHVFALLCTV